MMDGVSTMDTGNNGQLLQMNPEAIAEVKVLTAGYQAEYGRSSGLQITAVTKGGSNQFHGSLYGIMRNSDWNSNSWVNKINGTPKQVAKDSDYGYSFGGPVGRPGGDNKLFFFYSQEYRPRTSANILRQFRVPTALERQGDFSQTRDNNGNLFNLIRDPRSTSPCTAANTSGCFQDGGVLGRIPQDRLYQTGLNILKLWPMPNIAQAPGTTYNLEFLSPHVQNAQLSAGGSRGLSGQREPPDDGEIHGPEGIPRHDTGNDSRIQRHLQRLSMGARDCDDGRLRAELVDVHRGDLRLLESPPRPDCRGPGLEPVRQRAGRASAAVSQCEHASGRLVQPVGDGGRRAAVFRQRPRGAGSHLHVGQSHWRTRARRRRTWRIRRF